MLILIISLVCHMALYPVAIIGHRGACGYVPENTLSSFEKAIELKSDIVEFDVRRCASGELVVFHDIKVDRVTNGYGYIASKSLHELKQLKIFGCETIPTLIEALDFIDRRAKVYIELKDLNIVNEVLRIVDHYVNHKCWEYSDFIIASFDHLQLQTIKAINNKIGIAALFYGIPLNLATCASEIDACIVSLDSEFVIPQLVNEIHQRNMLVYVYTVNDKEDLFRLMQYKVDGIITDFPDCIREYSKNHLTSPMYLYSSRSS